MDAPLKPCVIVPTYNEKENVAPLVEAIEGIRYPGMIVLFVDDASPDGTAEEVRRMAQSRPWIKLLTRDRKMGIGSAYQSGFKAAISEYDADVLVEMDADLQHPPSALPSLLEAIREGADVAVASRYLPGGGIPEWSRLRRIVSRAANAYSRRLLGLTVRDGTSGFRAYTRKSAELVASADLPAKGFEFQVASLHVLKGKAKVVEVPFVFSYRIAGRSKLRLRDIFRFFFAVARISLM
jgi:dolichol-phosphate mannosyltransferase